LYETVVANIWSWSSNNLAVIDDGVPMGVDEVRGDEWGNSEMLRTTME
jgi:hypothetical protein